jgi:hypothetical protein
MAKNNQSGSIRGLVAVLIFLLVLACAGYAAYFKYVKQPADRRAAAEAAAKKNVQPPADPTAGWQEFTDPSGLFTLKIPPRWHYAPASGNTSAKIQPDIFENPKAQYGITQIAIDSTQQSPQDYYESKGLELADYTFGGDKNDINGYKAYTAFGKNNMPSFKVAVVENKGRVVQFFYYEGGSINPELSNTELIINTIKFNN